MHDFEKHVDFFEIPENLLLEVVELPVDRDRVVGSVEEALDLVLAACLFELLMHLRVDILADARPLRDLLEVLELAFRDGRLRPPHLPMEVRRLAAAHSLEFEELFLPAALHELDLLHRVAERDRVELLELPVDRHDCVELLEVLGRGGSAGICVSRNGYGALCNVMISMIFIDVY